MMTTKKIIDITHAITPTLPLWPESPGALVTRLLDMQEGAEANVSQISIEAHTGTHIDAPLHFVATGKTTLEIPLNKLIGPCQVVHIQGEKSITADILENLSIPKDCKKLLLKTDNQALWASNSSKFDKDFCALSADGAQWVVDRGIELIGIDYLSIQRFHDSIKTHQVLLQNEVVILETLKLDEVSEGNYRLYCLPLKLEGLEGVPVRAILEF